MYISIYLSIFTPSLSLYTYTCVCIDRYKIDRMIDR